MGALFCELVLRHGHPTEASSERVVPRLARASPAPRGACSFLLASTYRARTLLHGLHCIFDLVDAALRAEGDAILVVLIAEHGCCTGTASAPFRRLFPNYFGVRLYDEAPKQYMYENKY